MHTLWSHVLRSAHVSHVLRSACAEGFEVRGASCEHASCEDAARTRAVRPIGTCCELRGSHPPQSCEVRGERSELRAASCEARGERVRGATEEEVCDVRCDEINRSCSHQHADAR